MDARVPLLDLDISPRDGRLLASASADQTVRVWDLATRKHIRRFAGHRTEVMSVAFSPDSRRLYACDIEGVICAFTLDEPPRSAGPLRQALHLAALSASPDGNSLVGVRRDGTAWLFKPGAGEVHTLLPELGSNNTEVVFSGGGDRLFVAQDSGEIFVWDVKGRHLTRRLIGMTDVGLLETSRDGGRLVAVEWPSRVRAVPRRVAG